MHIQKIASIFLGLRCGCVCFQVLQDRNEIPLGCGVAVVNESISIYLALRNVVDINVEVSRLQKKRDDLIRYFFQIWHLASIPYMDIIHIQFYLNFRIFILLNGLEENPINDARTTTY